MGEGRLDPGLQDLQGGGKAPPPAFRGQARAVFCWLNDTDPAWQCSVPTETCLFGFSCTPSPSRINLSSPGSVVHRFFFFLFLIIQSHLPPSVHFAILILILPLAVEIVGIYYINRK